MKARHLMLLPVLLLCSCSLHQRVDRAMERIESQYAETKAWDELPLRVISWEQAVSMVKSNNRELKKIRDSISESERNELSVYTQMIPGVTFYGFFNRSLDELTNDINSTHPSYSVNLNVFLPTLTQVPYRVYASKATTFAAIKALEGKERELTAALYKHVRTAEVREKLDELRKQDPNDITDEDQLNKMDKSKWGELARLLGDASARWVILPETMPRVRWELYEPKLDKLDPLIVCQFALRLEQARLAQYNVALRYLPTVNANLYSPSLFSSTGGSYNGTFLDSKDTKINLNVSYALDTQMEIWNSYKRNKERYEQTKDDIQIQLTDYRNKLQQTKQSYASYCAWKSFMHKSMEHLQKAPVEMADSFLERNKQLYNMKKELLTQEMQSIETEAALIVQYGLLKH